MDHGWLLIDIAHKGQVRMALASPERPHPDRVHVYDTTGLPTFTDALLRFERETESRLRDLHLVIAIAGAVVGDTIPVVRTRWNISRSGLAAMLQRPVTILNDVAAQAWATVETMPTISTVRGSGTPDLRAPGRYLFLTVEDGIGTAVVDIAEDGRTTVLAAEGGHCAFAAASDLESGLCRALAPGGGPVSFEQVLTVEKADPAWRVLAALSDRVRVDLRANILGRLAANLTLATGAWQGVMLHGRGLPDFDAAARGAFDAGFCESRSFRRLFAAARCWRVEQRESVLAGAAALMMQRHRQRT